MGGNYVSLIIGPESQRSSQFVDLINDGYPIYRRTDKSPHKFQKLTHLISILAILHTLSDLFHNKTQK